MSLKFLITMKLNLMFYDRVIFFSRQQFDSLELARYWNLFVYSC